MRKAIRIISFIGKLFLAYVCALTIQLVDKQKRNVWIISERGDDARDNGFFFFKFVVDNHPEQPIWYIIKSTSADYEKVHAIGNTIEYGSFRHFVYFALAKVRISAHMWGGDLPYADYFNKLRRIIRLKKTFIFLKHGIIKDYLPQHTSVSGNPSLYVCGAKPEYEYVKAHFGHPEGVVKYTGLARFDNLHEFTTKRQILVMPTFRRWLQKMSDEEVAVSEYVKKYESLLNNALLIEVLEQYGVDLVFYPHHVMQKYVDVFSSGSNRVKIAKAKDYDVQSLLKESALLVTDFSSVFFDFGYMNKPVIYYQFDRERYIKEHYDFTKGYFGYEENGFGEVVFDEKRLVASIINQIEAGFRLGDLYQQRIDVFFPLKDKQNCARIYSEIKGIKKSR